MSPTTAVDASLRDTLAVLTLLPSWLAEERHRRRLGYKRMQAECGVSSSYLFKIATDPTASPSGETLVRLILWLRQSRQIDMNTVPAVYLAGPAVPVEGKP